jgi:tRNA(Ile)-lysidine synthase
VNAPPRAADLLPRCTFPPSGAAVTCAVSGGADSLALLALAVEAGCRVTAIHVDHGLRSGSAAEADAVCSAAARFGASFRAERVRVDAGPNLEARARAARYAILPRDVLTGHTADDQAETLLLNLLRGAGPDGMAGMRPERHPLLSIRRHETAALCTALGLQPVEDPTNRDPAHLRNRVRHELLPLLDRLAARDVAAVLARQAEVFRDDTDLLDELARGVDPTDARALAAAPVALARRAVRDWLSGEHPPDRAAVERVLAVARGDAISCDVGRGRRVERHQQRLSLVMAR